MKVTSPVLWETLPYNLRVSSNRQTTDNVFKSCAIQMICSDFYPGGILHDPRCRRQDNVTANMLSGKTQGSNRTFQNSHPDQNPHVAHLTRLILPSQISPRAQSRQTPLKSRVFKGSDSAVTKTHIDFLKLWDVGFLYPHNLHCIVLVIAFPTPGAADKCRKFKLRVDAVLKLA